MLTVALAGAMMFQHVDPVHAHVSGKVLKHQHTRTSVSFRESAKAQHRAAYATMGSRMPEFARPNHYVFGVSPDGYSKPLDVTSGASKQSKPAESKSKVGEAIKEMFGPQKHA